MATITVRDVFKEKIVNFLKLADFHDDLYGDRLEEVSEEEYETLLESVSDKAVEFVIAQIKDVYEDSKTAFEKEYVDLQFSFRLLCSMYHDFNHLVCEKMMNDLIGLFIPIIGVGFGKEEMIINPIEWFHDKYDVNTQEKMFRYFDYFYWLYQEYVTK